MRPHPIRQPPAKRRTILTMTRRERVLQTPELEVSAFAYLKHDFPPCVFPEINNQVNTVE